MTAEPRAAKERLLQRCVNSAAWWLIVVGAVHLASNLSFGGRLGLRFVPAGEILAQEWGLASLCLGLFVLRSLRYASQQPLAVDILLLHFLAHSFLLLRQRVQYVDLVWLEWLSLAVDLGLAGALLWLRTPHKKLAGQPSLLTAQAAELPRLLKDGALAKRAEEPQAEEPQAKEPKEAPGARSKALPHMD